MTLRHCLARAGTKALVATLAALVALVALGSDDTVTATQQPPAVDSKVAKVEAAIGWYGCWTGGHGHPIPGHALISYRDGDPTYVDADLGFEIWLHPNRPANRGYHLHAFCP